MQNLSFHNQNLSQPKQTTVHPINHQQTDRQTYLNFKFFIEKSIILFGIFPRNRMARGWSHFLSIFSININTHTVLKSFNLRDKLWIIHWTLRINFHVDCFLLERNHSLSPIQKNTHTAVQFPCQTIPVGFSDYVMHLT